MIRIVKVQAKSKDRLKLMKDISAAYDKLKKRGSAAL